MFTTTVAEFCSVKSPSGYFPTQIQRNGSEIYYDSCASHLALLLCLGLMRQVRSNVGLTSHVGLKTPEQSQRGSTEVMGTTSSTMALIHLEAGLTQEV